MGVPTASRMPVMTEVFSSFTKLELLQLLMTFLCKCSVRQELKLRASVRILLSRHFVMYSSTNNLRYTDGAKLTAIVFVGVVMSSK